MKIVVLGGAGAMGHVIVRDLHESKDPRQIVIADFRKDKADELLASYKDSRMSTAFADITDAAKIAPALAGATVVINATPYYHNIQVMEAALQANCHYLDLGGLFHMTRKQLELNNRFKDKKLLAILGMGAGPGMTNLMAARAAEQLDTVESIDIVISAVDWTAMNHPFFPTHSLETILDEYTMEPMVFENGAFTAVPPMSGEIEQDFPDPVGKSKTILALHSEVATLPLTYAKKGIKRCTFRLSPPEPFTTRLKFLVELGFGNDKPLIDGVSGTEPRKILARMIANIPAEPVEADDCEVVRVDVVGIRHGKPTLIRIESTVYPHKEWKVSSDAFDTAVPPSIVAQMIGNGMIDHRGVLAPEQCVPTMPFFEELAKRGITMRQICEEALTNAPSKVDELSLCGR